MTPQARDEIGPTDNASGLRPAQELIATEADQVASAGDALLDHRLRPQPVLARVEQGAASKVFNEKEVVSPSELGQLSKRGLMDKADDHKIARMDSQEQPGRLANGCPVIVHIGA